MIRPLLSFAALLGLAGFAAAQEEDAAPPPEAITPAANERAPGIRVQVYDIGREAEMDRLLALAPDQTPNWEEVLPSLNLWGEEAFGGFEANFRTVATATLTAPEDGRYTFRLRGDDGVALWIDGKAVIVNDGLHEPTPADGEAVLSAGPHELRVDHFQGGQGVGLQLEWRMPGGDEFALLDGEHLSVDATITPVVSDGEKTLARDVQFLRPGDRTSLEDVHPAFALAHIRPPDFEPQVGAMALLPDGRLAISTFEPLNNGVMETEPNGTLYTLSGVADVTPEDGEDGPDKVTVTEAADNLWDPIGMVVTDGRLFVSETEQVTELIDADGDGFFETHEKRAGDWVSDNYHHFTFGLAADPTDPQIVYAGLSVSVYLGGSAERHPLGEGERVIGLNGPNPPNRGSIAKIDLRSGEIDYIAGGVRTPNGLAFGPGGKLFVTENQGGWMPASKINQIEPGHFYGYKSDMRPWSHYPEGGEPVPFQDEPFTPPALWMPQNQISNSPTQPLVIPDLEIFGPYAGQMLVGELTKGGIRRVTLQEVDGWYQGAVFRFSQGLEAGVNRLVFADDGQLYAGMTGYRGNWTWRGTTFGLQKLVPTGTVAFEMLDVQATSDGFEITFTKPADREYLAEPANYTLATWRYEPGPAYGGPDIDRHSLRVESAEVAEDGRSVRIKVPGLKAGYVVYLRTDPPSQEGETMWATEAWYTLNRIPGQTQSGGLSWSFTDGADGWPSDKREAIAQAMDEAVALYNEHGGYAKALRVSYNPETPTADANFNGRIRFGGQIGARTALHEIGHTLGVGTTRQWRRLLQDGRWSGSAATELLQSWDGDDAVLKGDRQHFWPYGLNYDREDGDQARRRHVEMVAALRKDMGLADAE